MARQFSTEGRIVLGIVQDNLPHTLTPFADIAECAGIPESQVLALLRDLRQSGAIRRFGASIRHQRTGWKANAMVAWVATLAQAEACAHMIMSNPRISHAYYRPSPGAMWPYSFYTMIHGRTEMECLALVHHLRDNWTLKEYAVLRSLRELKKISMRYFA